MKYSVKVYPDIKARVDKMDVESLLGAVICPDISAEALPEKRCASVFFYTTDAEKAYKASMALNADETDHTLIVSDMEYGAANVIFGATVFPSKLCGPAARNMMNGWMRYRTPVIFVLYNSASFGKTYKTSVDTLIETYGITKYTADKVIKLIRGE